MEQFEEIDYDIWAKMISEWDAKGLTHTLIAYSIDGAVCVKLANQIRQWGYNVTLGIGNGMHRQLKIERKDKFMIK